MKKAVLVVDDEREIVDFLESFLSRFDITTIKATTGQEALNQYDEYKPEFVFLDIKMPDKDGIEVLKELKERNPAVKVIMITGSEEKEVQSQAKDLGAIDYITKPLDLSDLQKKIKEYIIG